jgi:outer membrane protein assembly factor BamB
MSLHPATPVLLLTGLIVAAPVAAASDWPRWLGPNGDSVWRDAGIVDKFPPGGPQVRWRTPIGSGYSGPAVAGGRVFLTDRPAAPPEISPGKALERVPAAGHERVICLRETDGTVLWRHAYECEYRISYPAGPRAMPTVAGDRVYTLGAEGHLHCLDTVTGRVVWARNLNRDYGVSTQMWGYAASPFVDGDRVICLVGGAGHTVVAFDRETGAERWRAGTAKEPGYSTPTIGEAGGRRQLFVWDTEAVSGLDPETGRVFWSEAFKTKLGHAVITPRQAGEFLFVSGFFDGSLMLRLDPTEPKAGVAWRAKGPHETKSEALHSLMSPPFIEDGHLYGICSYGHLRCLKTETGERLWETLAVTVPDNKPARWASAFMVKNGNRFFLFNEKGDLIIARLSPAGYEEIDRTHLLDTTNKAGGRGVLWSHPAFANGAIYARNDREILCADLRAAGN